MLTRFDTAPITQLTTDPETGFIQAKNVPIARSGVFPYLKGDGSIEMEAKLPDEILGDSTVTSANNKPVTDDHPENGTGQRILVNKSNAKSLMKGFTASNAHVDQDTGTLRVDMTITDDDLIKKIHAGKHELSIGFQTDIVPVKGQYNGVGYDSVQKNIQINHVAVVKRGRAGNAVSLLGDSAEMIEKEKGQAMETTKVRIGDSTITVATDDADKVMKLDADNSDKAKKIATLNAQIKELTAQRDALQGKSDETSKNADEAQAKADALDKELQDTKKKYEGDAFDKAIEDRMNLIDEVKPIVGDSFDPKGKTEKEMKIEAIKTVDDSIDLDNKSDDYISAYFDSIKNRKNSTVVGVTSNEIAGDNADTSTTSLHASYYNRKK